MKSLFRAFCSLKLAIFLILSLTGSLITATIMESAYDTPTAQFWVYHSRWFYGLLTLLGTNILCVALSRLPWKPKHTPFLMAHAGILILLSGALITDLHGLDGSLRVGEGESTSEVEVNAPLMSFNEGDQVKTMPIRWVPPGVDFKTVNVKDYGLKVDQLLSHADPVISFVSSEESAFPALKLQIIGGAMRITQEYWLWSGDPTWKNIQAGPAHLLLNASGPLPQGGPVIEFQSQKNGDLSYTAHSSDGKIVRGILKNGQIQSSLLTPGWKGDVKIKVMEWIPAATSHVEYVAAKIQYGAQAPPSAIHVQSEGGDIWLGLGDRATLQFKGRTVGLGYFNKHVVMPFAIKLHRFNIEHYEGTRNPSEFSSRVSVLGATNTPETTISMNEPLTHGGITFYQASYEDAEPRPTISIFSVNRDPGRPFKYFGSLLLVSGTILLFAMKYVSARAGKKAQASSPVRSRYEASL